MRESWRSVPATTSTVYETVPTTAHASSETVVTVAATAIIVLPATTTSTSTVLIGTAMAATVTTTAAATMVAGVFASGIGPLVITGSSVPFAYAVSTNLMLAPSLVVLTHVDGAPYVEGRPAIWMYVRFSTTSYGRVMFACLSTSP